MNYFDNFQDNSSIKNLDGNSINLNLDNSFPNLEYNGYGLGSNYHSIFQNYIQNLDEIYTFSNINTEKLKNEVIFDNLSSIKNIEDNKDSENNNIINSFVDNTGPFFIFNSGDYNDYSKNIINEVSTIIKNERKKRIRFYKHGNEKKNKKIKNILKRKDNTDNIRKKIICKFFRILKNKINKILDSAGIKKKYRFNILPQKYIFKFISILSKRNNNGNKEVLDLTLEQIFSKQFCENCRKNNLDKNLSVLKYLETNKNTPIFNIIRKIKFSQIFNEHLQSKDFQMEIANLKEKDGNNDEYIKNYIIISNNLLN